MEGYTVYVITKEMIEMITTKEIMKESYLTLIKNLCLGNGGLYCICNNKRDEIKYEMTKKR